MAKEQFVRTQFRNINFLLEVGGDGFEPPKSKDNRFTVCPIWPLWKPPFCFSLS